MPSRRWAPPDGRTRRASGSRYVCVGERNGVDAAFTGTDVPGGRLDGFIDSEDSAVVLTHPLGGFFRRPDGRLGQYSVWHPRLRPTIGTAVRARYAVFERIGLVGPAAVPHSVLLQPSVEFDVHLPPAR